MMQKPATSQPVLVVPCVTPADSECSAGEVFGMMVLTKVSRTLRDDGIDHGPLERGQVLVAEADRRALRDPGESTGPRHTMHLESSSHALAPSLSCAHESSPVHKGRAG